MARWCKGRTKMVLKPKTASVTFTEGDIVQMSSGYVATATAQSIEHIGIIRTAVTSGDADFASTTLVAVEVPLEPSAEFECTVTGTLLTTSIGVAYDLSTAGLVNKAGTTYKVALCKGFISSAKGRFSLNSNADYQDA